MSVIVLLILISLGLATAFLTGFIWAVKAGQFEDTCTPSMRILTEEDSSHSSQPSVLKPVKKPTIP